MNKFSFLCDYLGNKPNAKCIDYYQFVIRSDSEIHNLGQKIKNQAIDLASKQIAKNILNQIIDALGSIVTARFETYKELVTHGLSYYYIIYAYKCLKPCPTDYTVDWRAISGSGGFAGRNAYAKEFHELLQKDKKKVEEEIAKELEEICKCK